MAENKGAAPPSPAAGRAALQIRGAGSTIHYLWLVAALLLLPLSAAAPARLHPAGAERNGRELQATGEQHLSSQVELGTHSGGSGCSCVGSGHRRNPHIDRCGPDRGASASFARAHTRTDSKAANPASPAGMGTCQSFFAAVPGCGASDPPAVDQPESSSDAAAAADAPSHGTGTGTPQSHMPLFPLAQQARATPTRCSLAMC
jgi:hypothetical protein